MKTSFDWKRLKNFRCPNMACEGLLHHLARNERGQKNKQCKDCGFVISEEKFRDLLKGKESKAYQARARSYADLGAKRNERRNRMKEALLAQERETAYNRAQMERKGLIGKSTSSS